MPLAPRLTKNSSAFRPLRAKLEKKELTGKEEPKSVWASEPNFQVYHLANFRTRYNSMRKEYCDDDGIFCVYVFIFLPEIFLTDLYCVKPITRMESSDGSGRWEVVK